VPPRRLQAALLPAATMGGKGREGVREGGGGGGGRGASLAPVAVVVAPWWRWREEGTRGGLLIFGAGLAEVDQ